MDRVEMAKNYFKSGYNCSQSVVLAFSDLIDIDKTALANISSTFGAGMGRLREVCGAVSGMFIVCGYLYGFNEPTSENKKSTYEKVQELGKKFENNFGSLVCRNLLNLDIKHDDPTPSERTNSYYQKRPCIEMVSYAVTILEEFINKEKGLE